MITDAQLDNFAHRLSMRGMRANSIRAYCADVRGVRHLIDVTDWAATERALAAHLGATRSSVAPTTTLRRLSSWRAFAKIFDQPVLLADYIAPTPAKPEPHPLPEGFNGVEAMLENSFTNDEKMLVVLTGMLGLRVGEAVDVHEGDIIYLNGVDLIVRGKGDVTRIVPINDQAWEVIEPILSGNADNRLVGMSYGHARRTITRLGVEAGICRRVSSHDMRSTFLTEVYQRTKDLRVTQELAGHASPVTTQRYTGISGAAKRAAVNAL